MKISRIDIRPYALPLPTPIQTAVGRFEVRRGVWIEVHGEDGSVGIGESAPWPGFGRGEAAMNAALEGVGGLIGHRIDTLDAIFEAASDFDGSPEVVFGLESALLDALSRSKGVGASSILGCSRSSVAVHALAVDAASAQRAVEAGFGTLKVKIGAASVQEDVTRLRAMRAAVGADVAIRADANGAWSVAEAIEALEALSDIGLELVEQPVDAGDILGLAAVRGAVSTPIAADEAVKGRIALENLLDAQAVDVVVLKPMFVGGIEATLEMAARAEAFGVGVMVTHALESLVGRLAALHVAAAIDSPLLACGLAGAAVGGGALKAVGGVVSVLSGVGLGERVGEAWTS